MQLDERLIIAPIRSTKSGMPGPMGPQGPKGEPGLDGSTPKHRWAATSLQFTNPDGSWGSLTDLKGEKGDPGTGDKISVQDQSGVTNDLELIKYDTSNNRIVYNPVDKSLSFKCVDHSYQLDWSVNLPAELPSGDEYIGAVVYVKSTSSYMWYDGTDWKVFGSGDITPTKLFENFENGKWGDAHLTPNGNKIVIDSKDCFLGKFSTIDELKASPLKPVNNQSIAMVGDHMYGLFSNVWEKLDIGGNIMYSDGTTDKQVSVLEAGDNVTMQYDPATKKLTINAASQGTPTDLSKYVRGENVKAPHPQDWASTAWSESSGVLEITVLPPDFTKMNSVLIAGDNIKFERDVATDKLKLAADFNVDLSPYVRGSGITSNNGITAVYTKDSQSLVLGYAPTYAQLSPLFEAGDGVTIEKGSGEKLKITSTPALQDLSAYAKKNNITVPNGFWGSTEVSGEDVLIKVKPTAAQLLDMFSTTGDMSYSIDGDKVKINNKDGRKRLYNILINPTGGVPAMLKAGNHISLIRDDTNKVITIESSARELESTSIQATTPIKSDWDSATNQFTVSLGLPEFTNLTDPSSNVKVTYDATGNKLSYNIDKSIIPVAAIKKDNGNSESLGTLQILNAGDNLVIESDPDNPGKKLAKLIVHDKYEVTGHANNKDQKMTDLTMTSDVDSQVVFLNGNMQIDLTKGYYVGRVNAVGDLPTKAVADKSYGYVKSADSHDRQYMFDGAKWNVYTPLAGMLLTDGTTNQTITQIKNNNAVTFKDGELTINQTGMVYKDNGTDKPLHSIEVVGAGVSVDFSPGTGSLKLDVTGSSAAVQSPIKFTVVNSDGSVSEFADTREIRVSGDVAGVIGTDNDIGGKKVTIPIGIISELNTDVTKLTNKYDPSKYKGKMIFGDSVDAHSRKWFGCDGERWIELTSKDQIDSLSELLVRFKAMVSTSASADSVKEKTSWSYIPNTAVDSPEYEKSDGTKIRVDGFVMNITGAADKIVQVFYPASEFDSPQYRRWDAATAAWIEWQGIPTGGGGSGSGGDVDAHNKAQDAHEAILLPAVVATTQTTWYGITDGQSTSRLKGNIPLSLLSDSTGRADIIDTPTGTDLYSLVVPRSGSYNMKWMFQITGAVTANGTLTMKVSKNGTVIHTGTQSIATSGNEFDVYELMMAQVVLVQGDKISLTVEYSGSSSWDENAKKKCRLDPMKNYFVLEHKDSRSGTLIADTFRKALGGFVAQSGFESRVGPDQLEDTHAALVEVTGSKYNTTVVHVK
ncbi:MAG: hypothetical protein ACRC9Y_16190 [Aeromonas veronii]